MLFNNKAFRHCQLERREIFLETVFENWFDMMFKKNFSNSMTLFTHGKIQLKYANLLDLVAHGIPVGINVNR